MRLYYAAAESSLKELANCEAENLLISMANGKRQIPKVPEFFKKYSLIIDSGAFTYQKKGGIILKDWIAQAKSLRIPNSELVGLDVIGNAEKTFENHQVILQEIPDAIPTFHVGSDLSYLFKYVDTTDRICIGGMVSYKSEIKTLKSMLIKIFSAFSGRTLPKFHAFGYFSPDILESYPWYSADASTWQNYARFGEFHKFHKMKYLRMKSVNVADAEFNGLSIDDLHTYMINTPELKLTQINKAMIRYENFLTELWQERGTVW